MDERSIHITAHHLINRFGDEALERVNACIEEAAEEDNDSAVMMWHRIYCVIDEWQQDTERRTH